MSLTPESLPTENTTVPFRLRTNLIVVDVRVNGETAGFLLDTGASSSLIGRSLADRIGIECVERSAAMGAGGSVEVAVARLDSLGLGDLVDSGIACAIMDLTPLTQQIGAEVEGVLGFDFFGRGTLHVDYPARTVRIERPIATAGQDAASVESRTAMLPEWKVTISWPDDAWTATTDTPLPSMPLLITGPDGAEISVTQIRAIGLSAESARASIELSVPAQVDAYSPIASAWVEHADLRAFRMEYTGLDDDARPIRGWTHAILRDHGLLVLNARAPGDPSPELTDAIESILRSVTHLPDA